MESKKMNEQQEQQEYQKEEKKFRGKVIIDEMTTPWHIKFLNWIDKYYSSFLVLLLVISIAVVSTVVYKKYQADGKVSVTFDNFKKSLNPSPAVIDLPEIDLATATPEDIEAYAKIKREKEQAALIAARQEELNEQHSDLTLEERIESLESQLSFEKIERENVYTELNDKIIKKQFQASTLNGAIDYQQIVDRVTPLLIHQILDTPEGRKWLEETIAWYVKRDIEKYHKGHNRN